MSNNGRFIVVTNKPRILRHHSGWMCVGLQRVTPRWWFRPERLVTRYGVTPQSAFNAWLLELDGRALAARAKEALVATKISPMLAGLPDLRGLPEPDMSKCPPMPPVKPAHG